LEEAESKVDEEVEAIESGGISKVRGISNVMKGLE
jgi:hypothetical protein